MGICACILLSSDVLQAATPRVMLSDYKIKEGEVEAGKDFHLEITMQNTAKAAVKNIKVAVSTDGGEFIPAEGAGTAYCEQIAAESEETFSFHMEATSALEEKSYKILVKTVYESTGGWEYNAEDAIFIPIKFEQKIKVTDISCTNEVQLGDSVEITASINNLGLGTVHNVTAQIIGDNLMETDNFVGNIETGKNGMADLLTQATKVTGEGDGQLNQLIITYEDKEGNVYTEQKNLNIVVKKPEYKNLEKIKEESHASDVVKRGLKWLIPVLVIVGIIYLLRQRSKRKQQLLEEFAADLKE